MGNDGVVVIGTTLDTKQLEKQLKEQESQLKKYEREAEKLTKTKVDLDLSSQREEIKKSEKAFDDLEAKIKQLARDEGTYKKNIEKLGSDWRISNVNIDGQDYTRLDAINRYNEKIQEAQQLEQELYTQYQQQGKELNKQYEVYSKNVAKVKEINELLKDNARNQAVIRGEIEQTNEELGRAKGFGSIKKMLDDVGKKTEKNIKKVGKWALALFGIRAMYGFIRNSINTISEGDEQLKADIDYMKTALAYTFEPIIRKIIELIKQLMQYLGYIIYMWTGKDIFANANKHLKSASKSAKELKKQLAGFDEANVLSDKDSGAGTPSFKLGGYKDMKPPTWLQWIVDHSKEIFAILTGIALALTLIKLGIDWITASGFGLLIAGVVYAVASLIDYINDPSWQNFGSIIIGIGVAVVGLGIIFGNLPLAIGGAIAVILGLIITNWDKIKDFLQKGIDWLGNQSDWVREHFGEQIGNLYDFIVKLLQDTLNYYDVIFSSAKRILDGIIEFITGVFTGNWDKAFRGLLKVVTNIFNLMLVPIRLVFNTIANIVSTAINNWKSIFKGAINFIIDGMNKMINGLNKIKIDKPSWLGGGQWGINIPNIPRLATGGIVNMPNRGVMVGGAIAGESGREGVIPLTDPTAMAQLGKEIGQWINLAIDNKMVVDGRVLATATNNQINKENFLMNR